jgi:putative endonuclease
MTNYFCLSYEQKENIVSPPNLEEAAMKKGGGTYILGSLSHVLYIGVTSDIVARMYQHKTKSFRGFTAKYHVDRLLYREFFDDIRDAIAREKQLKGWLRQKKLALTETANSGFLDLAAGWFDPTGLRRH